MQTLTTLAFVVLALALSVLGTPDLFRKGNRYCHHSCHPSDKHCLKKCSQFVFQKARQARAAEEDDLSIKGGKHTYRLNNMEKTLWDNYHHALVSQLTGGQGRSARPGLQLTYSLGGANSEAAIYDTDSFHSYVDHVGTPGLFFNEKADRFHYMYKLFLMSLNVPTEIVTECYYIDSDHARQVNQTLDQIKTQELRFESELEDCIDGYQRKVNLGYKWDQGRYTRDHCSHVATLRQTINGLASSLQLLVHRCAKGWTPAMEAINLYQTYSNYVTENYGTPTQIVRPSGDGQTATTSGEGEGDWENIFGDDDDLDFDWNSNQENPAQVVERETSYNWQWYGEKLSTFEDSCRIGNTKKLSVSFDSFSKKSDYSYFSAGGSVGFLCFGGGAESSTERSNVASSGMKVSMSFSGIREVTIKPSAGWFTPEMFTLYKNKKDYISRNGKNAKDVFFHPRSGIMQQYPKKLIFVCNPSIILTMKNSVLSDFKTAWSAGGGFSLFGIGVSAKAQSKKATSKEDHTMVHFGVRDLSNKASLLAVDNHLLYEEMYR